MLITKGKNILTLTYFELSLFCNIFIIRQAEQTHYSGLKPNKPDSEISHLYFVTFYSLDRLSQRTGTELARVRNELSLFYSSWA